MLFACHSNYSLLFGTQKVENLVGRAKELGIPALVLTDINNSSACLDFVRICREKGIKPICGIEFRTDDQWLYTCIAQNNEGFKEINHFLSDCNLSKRPLPTAPPEFSNVLVVFPSESIPVENLKEYEFIGIQPHEINRALLVYPRAHHNKLLAFYPVTFQSPNEYEFHRHLRAIEHNILLSMLKPHQTARPSDVLISPDNLKNLYQAFPALVTNAEQLLQQCSFEFNFSTPKNKQVFSNSRYHDKLLLEKLAFEGMVYRYGTNNAEAERRLRNELEVIDKLGFSAYFLITWDMIHFTMSQGIYHVGRGSGGNSIVAYCLRITDIDPVELNLYFERFINPQRTSPPDFDIDYSWKDRDYVHDYMFKRYGREHTALLGATTTFQDSSIIRELGKVYGLPKDNIDALVENPGSPLLQNDITKKIFSIGHQLLDFPHHRTIHAGGVLVSDLSIYYYTALDLPPKGLPTTQWDMYVAENIGLDKLDILSQRGLGHIRECAEIVEKNRGIKIDVHNVEAFKHDPLVNQRLYDGEAIGCFYIESPAMRGLLKKLKCSNYLSLVAASSIIRPGVAKSGMMREYIKRFHHQSEIKYLHPVFEEYLKETFGVMVYQEDVIKIAHYFAGLSLADADILRRAMSGKFRSKQEFERIRNAFYDNCAAKGYTRELAEEVWRQMSSFAGYAFCKAHSASYAVESYQSLYLKTYFPNEFHVAVINNFGGFYRTWVYVNEAKRWGAKINLPDINKSEYLTSLEGNEIYLGWIHLKGLEAKLGHQIAYERKINGPYLDFFDFTSRVPVGMEQLRLLIKSGAFRFTGQSKKELMWAQLLQEKSLHEPEQHPLFREKRKEYSLPKLESSNLEDAYDEMELLGFPVSLSKFDMLQTQYRGNTLASDLLSRVGHVVRMVGDLVAIKYVHTVKKEWMHFGCFLDTNGQFFDTVHFPDSLKKYPFTGYGIYLIEGKVVEEFGFPSVEVRKLARLPYRSDPRLK
ncbi:MAG: DNA polymerase III subunit alpha [Bacteroidota bacterium]|nr:DNA polymerase III subunit alpha [Bacteroidota bacterium]